MELVGKTAIVTGGGSGVGLAIAEALVDAGCKVVITSRRLALLKEQAKILNKRGDGEVLALECDVRSKASVTAMYAAAEKAFGTVDVLINNSGLGVQDLLVDCSEEDWDLVMETNTKGSFLVSQAVLPGMIEKKSGYIINIASQAAKHGYKNAGPYCAAKFGVYGFGLALQEEVREYGIQVHSLCPALIQVPKPELGEEIKAGWLQVEDLADTVMFLLQHPRKVHFENIGLMGF